MVTNKNDYTKNKNCFIGQQGLQQGAGVIISTSQDLALFAAALFNGKLVSPQNLQMMEKITDGYGMDRLSGIAPNNPLMGTPAAWIASCPR